MITVIITLTRRHGTPQDGDCQGTRIEKVTQEGEIEGGRREEEALTLNHRAGGPKKKKSDSGGIAGELKTVFTGHKA